MPTSTRRPDPADRQGQVLVLFALTIVAMMAMAALLFDGGSLLVKRRELQNAGDAAALAAANLMQVGASSSCTNDRINKNGTGGTNDLWLKAATSVKTNLGWTDAQVGTRMILSCPNNPPYNGAALKIVLTDVAPGIFGAPARNVSTTSLSVNGQIAKGDFSVALLDPSNPSWRSNRNGCPSFLINGGPSIWFEGSVMVDSTCTLATSTSGAMKAVNASFRIRMVNNSTIRLGGEYAAGTATYVTPVPIQHYRPLLPDPLAGLVKPCNAIDTATNCLGSQSSLPSYAMTGGGGAACKGPGNSLLDPCILTPGTYDGGIVAGGGAQVPNTVLLRPGVYYLRGGGMTLKSASARIIAIPAGTTSTGYQDATAKTEYSNSLTQAEILSKFQSLCPQPTKANPAPSTCGVLIYNAPGATGSWNTNNDQVNPGAQGALLLRAYNPAYDTIVNNRNLFRSYKNLAFWQQRTPAPTGSGQTQPAINMSGGACVIVSGTFYAPGGLVDFGGGTCGQGGDTSECPTNIDGTVISGCNAVQFIVWDLTLSGNSSMYFAYNKDYFTVPTTYGLICDPASAADCPVASPTPGPSASP